ncbi:MAG: cysteine desulfurase SufS [Candidatus Dojkabacteria bacterium]
MDITKIREQFPILQRKINGHPLVYLDNAATTQKPLVVINAMDEYYREHNANIHRGIHTLSLEATRLWEDAHQKVVDFIGADGVEEVVFTRNSTESLNIIAQMLVMQSLKEGDIVVISEMEHHANIVPWQILQKFKKFRLEWIPLNKEFELDWDWFQGLMTKEKERVKVVSLTHASNVLGYKNEVEKFFNLAHEVGAFTILDAAQTVAHYKLDVKALDCDFMVFSGHKMYGPTGIGVLYGRKELLNKFEPVLGGGDMIKSVDKTGSVWNDLPWKFEAGTPDIAGGIGLGVAAGWVNENVTEGSYRNGLFDKVARLVTSVSELKNVVVVGNSNPDRKRSVVSLALGNLHPHDAVSFMDEVGIAVRGGYHCAEPLHTKLGAGATLRASFGIYNTDNEVDLSVSRLGEFLNTFN